MVLAFVFALLFVFGCTDFERANPHDPDGVNYVKIAGESSSSFAVASSSSGALVWCRVGGYCFENIHAETCLHELHGSLVANCNASSSSSPDVASGSSSSVELASSSSQEVLVSCQVGIDCILEMPDFMCAYTGTPVETCEVSSSSVAPSSSSVALQSSSSATPSSSSVAPSSSSVALSSSSLAQSSSSVPSSSSSCEIHDGVSGILDYGGQEYKTIGIGCQIWMAENLNYAAEGSRCYGDNTGGDSQGRCGIYGRLYNWSTAMVLDAGCDSSLCSGQVQPKHRGICPSGWHLPSDAEWITLTNYVGGVSTAASKLKAASGWNDYSSSSGNGTDDYCFSALPGGAWWRDSSGRFYGVGSFGSWWSSTEIGANGDCAWHLGMSYSYSEVSMLGVDKSSLFSVRCLRD